MDWLSLIKDFTNDQLFHVKKKLQKLKDESKL